jgi:hypothetical protein
VVSNKNDSDDEYHLVAWVGNITAVVDPIVDFEVRTTGGGATTVFSVPGTRIGSTDTYEAKWPVAQANGNYTVHATLFSGNTQVSTDSESVTVRKTGEAVEMSYPTTSGTLGVYDPPGETTAPGFVVDATATSTARGVTVFYGTAPPGTEQNWRSCNTQVTVSYSNGKDKRIGCTIAQGVTPESITGVAVVTAGTVPFDPGPLPNCTPDEIINPGPDPQCPSIDSGDAHRVIGYPQTPTSVTVSPSSSSPVINNCHELAAIVVDNLARPIWRAPVDVHATGPTDNLQFGDTTRTGNYQPPNQAGSHDSNEPSNVCGGTGTPPQQAEHNRPGATPDDKHIESIPATASGEGTDTSGGFIFALRSADGGTTAVDAWFDGSDNDIKDTGEASGTASVNWLSSSPSASRSPSGSVSATASRSASSTATASSAPASRSITLEASRNRVRFGKKLVLSGLVDSSQSGCEANQTVRIHRALAGGDFQELATATTGSDGAYSFEYTPEANATYRASVDASSSCQGAVSTDTTVLVRVRVKLNVSDQAVKKGEKIRLRATVAPCGNHDVTEVALMRSTGGRFREIKRRELNRECKASFRTRVKRDSSYKVKWPGQDDDHESGVSREVVVEVTRRR